MPQQMQGRLESAERRLTAAQRFRLGFGRWWYHRVHRLVRRKVTPAKTIRQIILAFVYISPILVTNALTWEEKRGPLIWFSVVYILVQLWRAYGDLEPQGWNEAREHYIDRKHEFARVIKRLATGNQADLDHEYQRDCLWLIANYVRAWRWDLAAKHIFANLLVEDPDDPASLIVVARDTEGRVDSRDVPKRYLKSERLIGECFETGRFREVGNVRIQSERVEKGCPYVSILGLPIKNAQGRVIGVVSIDSSLPYHFAMEGDLLEVYLQPYLLALRASLESRPEGS
jgi:hypothetical protein